jgi:hypothetical protein
MKLEFRRQIFQKYRNTYFTKIRPVGAEFFHAEGRTDGQIDMTKLIVTFRNFMNAPKNGERLAKSLSINRILMLFPNISAS